MNVSPATPQSRRRFRPRFSLLSFLIFVTLVGLAFPAWYRWPYEEESFRYASDALGNPDQTKPQARIRTTYQRQWGGSRLKHGLETEFDAKTSQKLVASSYKNGELHGPYHAWSGDDIVTEGEYARGKPIGTWRYYEPRRLYQIENWKDGLRDGEQISRGPPSNSGPPMRTDYKAGRLRTRLGQPVTLPVEEKTKNGTGSAARIAQALVAPGSAEFVETPLADVVLYLSDFHQVPVVLDSIAEGGSNPVTISAARGEDMYSVLASILHPKGLTCDYRFGSIWITTHDDIGSWRDRTGVYEIEPPAGSALAGVWKQRLNVKADDEPLPQVLDRFFGTGVGLELNLGAVESSPKVTRVTYKADAIEFRDALGALLYKTGCRCVLQGDSMRIEPVQAEPTDP